MAPDQIWKLYFAIPILDQLDLDESGLTGTIPSELGQLTKLGKLEKVHTHVRLYEWFAFLRELVGLECDSHHFHITITTRQYHQSLFIWRVTHWAVRSHPSWET